MSNLRFGAFTINRHLRQLRREDTVLPVSGKAFDLLVYMASNAGRPLSKSELLEAVWPDMIVEESNLNQNVFLLRKVLGGSDGPIKTLQGRGYQFAAEVIQIASAPAPSPAPSPIPAQAETTASAQSFLVEATRTRMVVHHDVEEHLSWRHPLAKSAIAITLVAILGLAGWFGWQRWLDHAGGPPVSVVFAGTDGTTGDPILDQALADALRMDLGQSPFVSILPRATVSTTLTQMMHKPNEVVTTELAREICERNNSQAVIHGTIARSGQHFLLMEEASNCVDGKLIAEAKQEAIDAEDLPHSIDKLAENLRQKLGESRRSIARFSMPLFHDNTPSIDALKAFTQGTQELREGKITQSIGLLKTALADDPKFAAAQFNLAIAYASAGDDADYRAEMVKAYSLKDLAMRPTQFSIETTYNDDFVGDTYANLRNIQNWVELYPNSSQAWSGLANIQGELGLHSESLVSNLRTVQLLPHSQAMLANLAKSQMENGDLKASQATCDRAIADNLDGDGIRVRYLQLAYLMHDPAMLQAQRDWEHTHPLSPFVLANETQIAISEGRFADAHKLVSRTSEVRRQQGVNSPDDKLAKFAAVDLIEAGDVVEARKIFQASPVDPQEGKELVGLVYVGDIPAAQAGIRAFRTKLPKATAIQYYWGPQVDSAIAMAEHKPKEAAAILEIARPMEKLGLVIPWMRGEAYLAAGQPALAEKDFRDVLAHPEWDPTSQHISLSWLGLGRALAAEGNRAGAIDAYQHFLALWAHADLDALFLIQAKQELATLQKPH